jgi:[acyl-carrier-protein] S-malonyltransferase
VLCNVTGAFHNPDSLVDHLVRQISGRVRWVENMAVLAAKAPSQIVEIGPSRPLRGFFRGLDIGVDAVTNVLTARRAVS